MIDWLKGAWEWIAAVGAAIVGLFAAGWWLKRQGAANARAKMKAEKARREKERADKHIEKAGEMVRRGGRRQERASKQAEKLKVRARRRLEEAAVERGRSAEEATNMSDEEIMEAVGGG